MKRLAIWLSMLVILIALAVIFDRGHPIFAQIVMTVSLVLLVRFFLARPKAYWLGGVLGAADGAALGWWFERGFDAFIPLSIGLGVLGLILYAFLSAVKNSGKSWKSSNFIDRQLEEIAYFGNQPTGFFSTPAPPARSFKRKDLAPTSTDDAWTGSADTEKVYPTRLKEDGSI